ncbi:hypothetical protein ISN45_At02g024170 [Arabidopsis thaliana x Arabidopsis arenosa]|uniref:Uncharacterized protein n=2 Tax=Arabidopsis TaxID=3701 RepID=A0A8T2G1L8_ARASU|nr:hypothetical protein ISN45_At02g024170 [Arabidopsis thaliana x Arabidopsis arenosa]KAG7642542.1 hypothetical protein ISN44_As02g024520 [Arabidopsis suecica]
MLRKIILFVCFWEDLCPSVNVKYYINGPPLVWISFRLESKK